MDKAEFHLPAVTASALEEAEQDFWMDAFDALTPEMRAQLHEEAHALRQAALLAPPTESEQREVDARLHRRFLSFTPAMRKELHADAERQRARDAELSRLERKRYEGWT